MSSLNANSPYDQVILPYKLPIDRTTPIPSQHRKAASQHAPVGARSSSRMSKAEALTIVRRCKRWLIAGSLVAFGVLSALVASHVVGSTSDQAPSASNSQVTPPANGQITSSTSDGGFFEQPQPQLQLGGGYGFGDSNSWQPPVSRSHVS
jgi:hypothetical protein